MTRAVPSRTTLRYLRRIVCTDSNSILPSRTRICAATQPHPASPSSHPYSSTSQRLQQHTTTSPPQSSDNTILPTTLPDISTFYTIFPKTLPSGPPSSTSSTPFEIDLSSLRREFLSLQSQFHPDKYPTSSPSHQKAVALSSLINNAYRTLSDPLLRAQYLLNLQYNVDVMSEDNSEHSTDQETLMDVMAAQEAVDEANAQEEVERLKDENKERISETVTKMADAFERGDRDEATQECVRLKYWRSLQQGLNDWEEGKEVRLVH